ncbi:hypothetical protein [uncultured Paraglaciecola sp.]|uniref:hypothetical protein n=1 Tax=uncultured Paraglaciecola sp. TaxID=1765024 RepID=UPI00262585D7|nr:hypothetical protein [uncultured Paraglaciecola sp.]
MTEETMYSIDGEMFRYHDLDEAVRDRADDFHGEDVELPLKFVIYETDFVKEPASYYMPIDIIEQMDEKAYDELGEEGFGDGLFAKHDYNHSDLNKELKAAIDAVFTKHNMQPTVMVGAGSCDEHAIEWRGPDDWSVVVPDNTKEGA